MENYNTFSGYEALTNAIIIKAAEDYESALISMNDGAIMGLERFFNGDYIKTLTKADGSSICAGIQKMVEDAEYNRSYLAEMKKGFTLEQAKQNIKERRKKKRRKKKKRLTIGLV